MDLSWRESGPEVSFALPRGEHVVVFQFTDMVVQSWASLLMDFHMLERFLGSRTNGFLQDSMAAAMHWYIFAPRVLQRWYWKTYHSRRRERAFLRYSKPQRRDWQGMLEPLQTLSQLSLIQKRSTVLVIMSLWSSRL